MVDELVQKWNATYVRVCVDLLYLGILDFTMWMNSLLKIVLCERKGSEVMIKRGGVEILFPRCIVIVRPSAIGAEEDEWSTLQAVEA